MERDQSLVHLHGPHYVPSAFFNTRSTAPEHPEHVIYFDGSEQVDSR
jgi:hypothetical protein